MYDAVCCFHWDKTLWWSGRIYSLWGKCHRRSLVKLLPNVWHHQFEGIILSQSVNKGYFNFHWGAVRGLKTAVWQRLRLNLINISQSQFTLSHNESLYNKNANRFQKPIYLDLLLALYHLQSLGIDIISYPTPYDNFYYTIYLHSFAALYTVTGLCRLQSYNTEGLYLPTEFHSSCHIHLIYLAWLISSLNQVLAFGQAVDCFD